MLRFISIDNFALIDHLEVDFEEGLNLITGETGSGKSILVDAVSLLVGARASQEMIRQGFEKAQIEGEFTIPEGSNLNDLLAESGLEGEEDRLIIRRELSSTGSNRVFVNGRLSTLTSLAEVGIQLVDIHGQHGQQQLLHPSSHLDFLDQYARNRPRRNEVKRLYSQLSESRSELEALERSEQDRLQRMDLLRYQIEDIEKLDTKIDRLNQK